MCYSSLAEKNFEKLHHELGATPWPDAFDQLRETQEFEASVGSERIKEILRLTRKPTATKFKYCDEDGRFYPNWFAPVIIEGEGKKVIMPMRYRVRPANSGEVPTKYNMHNARVESLLTAKNWRPLIGRKHAVIAIQQFYEFVNKKELGIAPLSGELLKVAAIYDEWTSPGNEISFKSFAIITGPPPESVQALGHHRCPITLSNHQVDDWLSMNNSKDAIDLLNSTEMDIYKKVEP